MLSVLKNVIFFNAQWRTNTTVSVKKYEIFHMKLIDLDMIGNAFECPVILLN